MLHTYEFHSRIGNQIHIGDDSLIDIALETMYVDGESVVDIFYLCESFEECKVDFGGGIHAITCRDVLAMCDSNPSKLRDLLKLRTTKQNNALCEEIIDILIKEVNNSGYIF